MIKFYFTEAVKSIGRAKFSSLITVLTTAVSIIFTTLSIMLIIISSDIDTQIKDKIIINLFIQDSVTPDGIILLTEQLEKDPRIENVRFISKQDAANSFLEKSGTDFQKVLEENPLPASYAVKFKPEYISLETIDQLVMEFQKLDGIESAVYDANLTFRLLKLINSIKLVIYIVSVIFISLAIYLTYSTQKILINAKLEQYKTMKLVGAKLRTIKIPLILNGVFLGFVSALICLIPFNIFIYFLNQKYVNLDFTEIINFTNIIVLILGISLPILGSLITTRNITPKIERI